MIKQIFLVLGVLLLIGCTPTATDKSNSFSLPYELRNCTVYRLMASGGELIYVVTCPDKTSTTTVLSGKAYRSVTVLE